jgi:hypothetical protein
MNARISLRVIQKKLKNLPTLLGGSSFSRLANSTLILLFFVFAIATTVFLSSIEVDRITSRETLQLTSSPNTVDQKLASKRGRPLASTPGALKEDFFMLEDSKYKVYVGIQVKNNSAVDLKIPKFSSQGYIWLNWNKEFQEYLLEKNQHIEDVITFENSMSVGDQGKIVPVGKNSPQQISNDTYFQRFTYSNDFYIDSLDLRKYPFGTIDLPISFQADDPDSTLEYANLRLIPDTKNSGIGLFSDLFGWHTNGWSVGEYKYKQESNHGLAKDMNNGGVSFYSTFIIDVIYGRDVWSAFWMFIQPLIVVLTSIILITKITTDFRIEQPIAVLLTLIFLQDGYRQPLPPLNYLTYLDKIYAIAYLLTFVSFGLNIFVKTISEDVSGAKYSDLNIKKMTHIYNVLWPVFSLLFIGVASSVLWLI